MPFPLPLVPFESYMLADGSQAYPRAFVIEAQLTGKLNRAGARSRLAGGARAASAIDGQNREDVQKLAMGRIGRRAGP